MINSDCSIYLQNKGIQLDLANRASLFAEVLYRENQRQNLTRIVGNDGFYFDHLLDCLELMKLNWLSSINFDLGSGCGVPGLLTALLDETTINSRRWILCESENSKADFLELAKNELNLDKNVFVEHKRAENSIQAHSPTTILTRAVGKVDKIMKYIDHCSTWNNLILFKGPSWDQEWSEAKKTKYGKKLTIIQIHEYLSRDKNRILVNLKRL